MSRDPRSCSPEVKACQTARRLAGTAARRLAGLTACRHAAELRGALLAAALLAIGAAPLLAGGQPPATSQATRNIFRRTYEATRPSTEHGSAAAAPAARYDVRTEYARMLAKYNALAVRRGVDLWKGHGMAFIERIPPGPEAATATTLELWLRFDAAQVQKLDHGVILAQDPSGLVRLWFWPTNTTGQDTFATHVMMVGGPGIVAEGPGLGTITSRDPLTPGVWHEVALVYDPARYSAESNPIDTGPTTPEEAGEAAEKSARAQGATDDQAAAQKQAAIDQARVTMRPDSAAELLRSAGINPRRQWLKWPARLPWVYIDGHPAAGEVPEEVGASGAGMLTFPVNPSTEPTTVWWQSYRACVAATTPAATAAPPLAFVEYHRRALSSYEHYAGRTLGDCLAIGTMAPGVEVRASRSAPYARTGLQILTTMGTAEAGFRPIDQAAERAAVAQLAWTAGDRSRAPVAAARIPTPLVRVPSRTGFYIAGVMVLVMAFFIWRGLLWRRRAAQAREGRP